MKQIAVFFLISLFMVSCGRASKPGIDALITDSEKNISAMMDDYVKTKTFKPENLAEYDRIERAINSILFDMEMNKKVSELEKTQVKQKLMDSGKRIEAMAAAKGIKIEEFNKDLDMKHLEWLSVE